jgi:hypothetical protein
MFCMIACTTVPSRGATVASQLAACTPTAPGMLRATIEGSPGMWRLMWRATRRARRS